MKDYNNTYLRDVNTSEILPKLEGNIVLFIYYDCRNHFLGWQFPIMYEYILKLRVCFKELIYPELGIKLDI